MTSMGDKLKRGWPVLSLLLVVTIAGAHLAWVPGQTWAATKATDRATPVNNTQPATNGSEPSAGGAQPSQGNKSASGSTLAPWEKSMPQPTEEELKEEGMPEKEKQLVYSVSPWTATEKEPYGGTFVPKSESTFFLLADHPSLVNPVRTEVYYWPITKEYMADWFGFREDVPGKLEILQNGEVIKTLEKVKCTFKYGGEDWTAAPTLIVGEEAVKEYKAYSDAMDAYYKAMTKYYEEYDAWNKYMDKLIQRVQKTGKPAEPEEIPEAPKQPEPPKIYVTEPTEAFLVNLAAGEYEIRTVDDKGKVVPESEKRLVVVAPRRKGTGYVVIPYKEWARPFTSDDQSQPFYTWGATLYVTVSDTEEYDRYAYARLNQAHVPSAGKGMENQWQWVQTKERSDVRLQLVKNSDVFQEIVRRPFYVKQMPGYDLGYKIVPFDERDPEMQGQKPSLWGFQVVVPEGEGYQIRAVDAEGNVLLESVRDIQLLPTPLQKLVELTPSLQEQDILLLWGIISGADSRQILYTKNMLITVLQTSSIFLLASVTIGIPFSELEFLGYDVEWITHYVPPSRQIDVDLWVAIQEYALTLSYIPGAEIKALELAKKYLRDARPSGWPIVNQIIVKWFIRLQEMKQAGLINE